MMISGEWGKAVAIGGRVFVRKSNGNPRRFIDDPTPDNQAAGT